MSLPRALVVRSGANPFARFAPSDRIEIVEKSSHSIAPLEPDSTLLEPPADFSIFTSQVAVETLFADERLASLFRKATAGRVVVAVGPVTAEVLASKNVDVAFVAAGSGESVAERLPLDLAGKRVLLPCGEDASPELPERLRSRGARVTPLVLYRKVARPRDTSLEKEILENPFAAFCTTSPSAARWLFEGLGEEATRCLQATPAVVLGRFTRRFLGSHGVSRIEVTEEARFADALALLETLATAPSAT